LASTRLACLEQGERDSNHFILRASRVLGRSNDPVQLRFTPLFVAAGQAGQTEGEVEEKKDVSEIFSMILSLVFFGSWFLGFVPICHFGL